MQDPDGVSAGIRHPHAMRIGGAAGPALGAAVLALIGSYRPVMAATAVGFSPAFLPLRPFDFGASRTTLNGPDRRRGSRLAAEISRDRMRGTINPVPVPSRATKGMRKARRHPEMAGQRLKAGRTVGVTAPTGPVRGFFRPRPWIKPGAHGRIADGCGPRSCLELRMFWSAAWILGRSDVL